MAKSAIYFHLLKDNFIDLKIRKKNVIFKSFMVGKPKN